MSDHSRTNRKMPARIVPIQKVQPAAIPPRRPQIGPAPQAAGARSRAYGAPLAAASRLPRALRGDAEQTAGLGLALNVEPADGNAGTDSTRTRTPAGQSTRRPDAHEHSSSVMESLDSLIMWEQPPRPRVDPGRQSPRWMSDTAVMPSEADYAQLASQVGVLLAGFADFARAPGVVESGDWQARLPMPDTVLPETVLEMQVTPLHAKLRFETDNKVSRGVLHRYATSLQLQVKAALDDARVVEVVLW